MEERILSQAKIWGFICKLDKQGKYQILPQIPTERWKLQLAEEERWLLFVGDIPQVFCRPSDVLAFLERHRNTKTFTPPNSLGK
ncbi:hypothetical protein QUB80_30440 [Chlorogloeopsis sp. ULAP01]|uniref:hypothetical protein n=1 Tax=Chlorogloeopsis sp. ULAP01 TaxID=3056483 RepID=UPI0025AB0B64|nr:hypothetical protein [Chlorogloeopsis sp. ULAP01]MDM9384979.1 hypothetical protein [Chlorogloeopsis sp. ULAP01]